jgi:YHS domain-containing protein
MMKKRNLFSLVLVTLALLAWSAFAADATKQAAPTKEMKDNSKELESEAPAEKIAEPKELTAQTHCPVMGGKIDSTIYTDIQGQRVYHCCPMCSPKLKADLDKYFKKAAEQGILFENIQITCPVSGEKLEEKSVYTDYEGRRVYFCCKKCRGTFNENPTKYLSRLDEPAKAEQDVTDDTHGAQEPEHHEHHH